MPTSPRVFIVDDDASVRKSLERLMRSARLQTETFTSADAFLQRERQRYQAQLQRYQHAFAQRERRPVKTALYFTTIAHWLECD